MGGPRVKLPVARRVARAWDSWLPRITAALLVVVLLVFLVASFLPPVAAWIEQVKFGGSALVTAIALLFLDIISKDREVADGTFRPLSDSLQATPAFVRAAKESSIRIDFAGDSAETFKILVRETFRSLEVDELRSRKSLTIRILVPDLTVPLPVPCNLDGTDNPAYRQENWQRTRLSLYHILGEADEFAKLSGLKSVTIAVRFHHFTPVVKLYLLNNSHALWGSSTLRWG